jgi:hypothetical protein
LEKGRAFIGVHGVDRAMGSGPNAFPVEMASGNGGLAEAWSALGQFWKRRQRGWRERGTGVEWGL